MSSTFDLAKLIQALAGIPQDGSELRPVAEPWLLGQANDEGVAPPLIEDDAARADAAVRAVRSASASASVDDALAEVERQLADAQLRLGPERARQHERLKP